MHMAQWLGYWANGCKIVVLIARPVLEFWHENKAFFHNNSAMSLWEIFYVLAQPTRYSRSCYLKWRWMKIDRMAKAGMLIILDILNENWPEVK